MPEVMEGSHMAEILLVGAFRRLKFNAGDYMSLRQCRNLAKRDVQAVEIQCRGLVKVPAMQKSRQSLLAGRESAMQGVS